MYGPVRLNLPGPEDDMQPLVEGERMGIVGFAGVRMSQLMHVFSMQER